MRQIMRQTEKFFKFQRNSKLPESHLVEYFIKSIPMEDDLSQSLNAGPEMQKVPSKFLFRSNKR